MYVYISLCVCMHVPVGVCINFYLSVTMLAATSSVYIKCCELRKLGIKSLLVLIFVCEVKGRFCVM